MKSSGYAYSIARWAAGIAFAVAAALSCAVALAAGASAQTSADVQYGALQASAGPAAGLSCSALESDDGLLDAGDVVTFPGDFSVASGAAVVLDDADGTQGTLIDGQNARIGADGITIEVTGEPINVAGGDGVLNDTVCDSIVATTGVFGASAGPSGGSSGSEALVGLLPDTGGVPFLLLAALAAIGTGVVIVGRLRSARAGR